MAVEAFWLKSATGGAGSYQLISATCARANQLYVAATVVDGTDGQTDTVPLLRRSPLQAGSVDKVINCVLTYENVPKVGI